MFWSTIIMGVLALILLGIGIFSGTGQHILGLKNTATMTIKVLPLLIFAFIVAGMVQALIPREAISKIIGNESGLKGILIGSVAGALSPGGPFVCMPIAAGLFRAGASIGTMVAYLTGWSLWSLARLPIEVGFMGWKFTLIRLASTFIFPPLAGLIANAFFK